MDGKNAVTPVFRASSPRLYHDVEFADDEAVPSSPADGPKLVCRVIDTDFLIEVRDPDVWTVAEPLISHLKIPEQA